MVKFYNTLTGKKEVFEPLKSDFVRQYDCGPTVYWYPHIGNMWRYIMSDLIRRVLEYNGYQVKQVMNITDVGHLTEADLAADTGEDKMAVAAKREKKTPEEIAEFYTQAFLRDLDRLNIKRPHIMPKATDHIPDMIQLIKILENKGFAYKIKDRVCFDISKFKGYGKLSGKKLEELKVGARLEPIPEKRNPYDFSLWIVDPEHLMHWDSPWGVGYPGWHIECSAMSMKYLGPTLDIHTGGEDNIFPHHENEIAQSEGATGKQFVRYWIHAKFLQVEGEKMSKSLGNLYRIHDLVEKGFDPLAFRYLCLTAHYRSGLNFTWEGLRSAQAALDRLRRLAAEYQEVKGSRTKVKEVVANFSSRFAAAVNDDLNTPEALSVVWDMVKEGKVNPDIRYTIYDLLLDFDKVLGLGLSEVKPLEIPSRVQKLVEKREELREEGQFEAADEIRKKVESLGFRIEDTREGPRLHPL